MVLWILSQNNPEALVFPLGVLEARVRGTSGAVKESPSKPVTTLHACEPALNKWRQKSVILAYLVGLRPA